MNISTLSPIASKKLEIQISDSETRQTTVSTVSTVEKLYSTEGDQFTKGRAETAEGQGGQSNSCWGCRGAGRLN